MLPFRCMVGEGKTMRSISMGRDCPEIDGSVSSYVRTSSVS